MSPGECWYAIRTRSRHEKLVNDQLVRRGVETFLPLVERRRRWADRWKTVSFPLFAGYCFARFDLSRRLPIVSTVGVVEILGDHAGAVPIPYGEMESLRTLVTSTLPFDPHPYLAEGTEVEVIRGALRGARGLLVRKDRRARLVISVHLIRQATSVELDAYDVAPIRHTRESSRAYLHHESDGRSHVVALP
jgi:transcriptional antiterminator NusG